MNVPLSRRFLRVLTCTKMPNVPECARMCPNVPEFAPVYGLNVPLLLVGCVFSPASICLPAGFESSPERQKQNIYTFLWRRLSGLLSLRGPRGTFVHKHECRARIAQLQASTMDNHRAQSPRQKTEVFIVPC